MVTAVISLLAVMTFGLISVAFVSALIQLHEIDNTPGESVRDGAVETPAG